MRFRISCWGFYQWRVHQVPNRSPSRCTHHSTSSLRCSQPWCLGVQSFDCGHSGEPWEFRRWSVQLSFQLSACSPALQWWALCPRSTRWWWATAWGFRNTHISWECWGGLVFLKDPAIKAMPALPLASQWPSEPASPSTACESPRARSRMCLTPKTPLSHNSRKNCSPNSSPMNPSEFWWTASLHFWELR